MNSLRWKFYFVKFKNQFLRVVTSFAVGIAVRHYINANDASASHIGFGSSFGNSASVSPEMAAASDIGADLGPFRLPLSVDAEAKQALAAVAEFGFALGWVLSAESNRAWNLAYHDSARIKSAMSMTTLKIWDGSFPLAIRIAYSASLNGCSALDSSLSVAQSHQTSVAFDCSASAETAASLSLFSAIQSASALIGASEDIGASIPSGSFSLSVNHEEKTAAEAVFDPPNAFAIGLSMATETHRMATIGDYWESAFGDLSSSTFDDLYII